MKKNNKELLKQIGIGILIFAISFAFSYGVGYFIGYFLPKGFDILAGVIFILLMLFVVKKLEKKYEESKNNK